MLLNRRIKRISAAAAVVAFAGCAQAQPIGLPGSAQVRSARTQADQIYATSSDGKHIDVFSYRDGKLVRRFAPPAGTIALQGLCSDSSGDVFVTGLSKGSGSGSPEGHVYKYAHGGTKILKSLAFANARPFGCSVDPTSAALAVSAAGIDSRGGTLATFTPGSYYGTSHYSYDIQNFYYCAYDDKGNLFVDGQGTGTQMYLDELKKGQPELTEISLKKYVSVSGMGQLQWDGNQLTLEDLTAGAIYRLSVSGSTATVTGKSSLHGWNGLGLSTIAGSTILVPTGVSGNNIGFWKYPAGGRAVKMVSSPSGLFGLTISAASAQ